VDVLQDASALEAALTPGRVPSVFQPIVELDSGASLPARRLPAGPRVGWSAPTAAAEACRVADELSAAVGVPVRLRDLEVTVGASVGVGIYPADGEEFAALLHSADVYMYARKTATRGRVALGQR
jgi:predicted signal transduction protein with EAL and GGDEF domain